MSIAYFPEIYPDELLYSVLARFYLHSGYPIYTMIAEHLFPNTWKKPCIEFVGNLKQEILEIILRDITMEELINKHTMFPYYARFIPKDNRLKAFESIKNMQRGYMDLLKIPNREPRQLHYCPLCVKEDRQHYGEAYWHRIHQMAGVDVCPVHKCYLKESGIAIDTIKSSALISIEEIELCTEVIPCDNQLENHLAEYISKAEEVNEVAYELLEDIENEWLKKHKPKKKNSFMEIYRLRTHARLVAEEVVLHDVVNCFH